MNLQENIRRILREETSIKDRIQKMVLKRGWEETSDIFGGDDVLIEYGYDNDPNEYIKSLNLHPTKSENGQQTLFKDDEGKTIILYDKSEEILIYPYDLIYNILRYNFGMTFIQIRVLVEEFVSEYDIYPIKIFFQQDYIIQNYN